MLNQDETGASQAVSADGMTIANLLAKNRYTAIISAAFPVGDINVLDIQGIERFSEPFRFEARFAKPTPIQGFSDVPGQTLTVGLKLCDGGTRYFHGIITRFEYVGHDTQGETRRSIYVAEVRPWLMLLAQRRNFRVFQNNTSLDIARAIFGQYPASHFRDRTTAAPPVRPYTVQYDETDLDFVSRLLEQDGIYYYFRHQENQHELILADSLSAHEACDPEVIETHIDKTRLDHDIFWKWRESAALLPGRVAMSDYDHEKPNADLAVLSPVRAVRTGGVPSAEAFERSVYDSHAAMLPESITLKGADTDEVFTFPGRYTGRADGEFYARCRAEEIACAAYRVQIQGIARQVTPGSLFQAANPFQESNQERAPVPEQKFLAIGVQFRIEGELYDKNDSNPQYDLYVSTVEAIVATTPYRAPRRTPLPRVAGPQTARVVGHPGEAITTDSYGRIKVHFFWDRAGPADSTSSCWVRVAQSWAGNQFGSLVTPRIGQEVVVSFLHGNPDWPLVTGTVYNARNMPPVELPGLATHSTFRTRSVPDGEDGNELRFEDQAGAEKVYLRAQKNLEIEALANHSIVAGDNYSVKVPSMLVPGGALGGASPLGSRIEMGGDSISFTVTTPLGRQALILSPEGITLFGSKIELLATTPPPAGGVTSLPFVIPGTPAQLAAAIADMAKEEALSALLP